MEGDQQSERDHHGRRYARRLPQPGKGRIIGQQPVPQAKPERHGASACPHARSVSGMTTLTKQLKHAAVRSLNSLSRGLFKGERFLV